MFAVPKAGRRQLFETVKRGEISLAEQAGRSKRLMIDATHLKAHPTSASLLKKGLFPVISDGQKAA